MNELTSTLGEAIAEIKNLRHENEILRAKVSVIDVFSKALNPLYVSQSETMRVDPLWRLEQLLQAEVVATRLQGQASQGGALAGSQQAEVQANEKLAQWEAEQAKWR